MEFKLDNAREILVRTPATLSSLLRDLPEDWSAPNEGPETWSPFDVVGHLVHAEEADWIPRARIILDYGETGTFEPFDRLAMFEKSKGKTLNQLLDEFARLREANLRHLDGLALTTELLPKRGMHPEFGAVTLSQLLATWVVHDLGHIGQIARVMAKQFREAVGPWQAYLPVLTR